tara:strand:+ start:771 stop:1229 length:459 start_codon:yes stop_codon:yes gene_type:complete
MRRNKLVMISGVFDLFHAGHIYLIQDGLGQVKHLKWTTGHEPINVDCIMAINSDLSVKRLKGPDRPIMNQDARRLTLLGIKGVDEVVIFNELTPEKIVKKYQPDYYIKGHEYREHELPEITALKYNIKVIYVDTTGYPHTSDIINKIKNSKT